jgi:hypothetical protein
MVVRPYLISILAGTCVVTVIAAVVGAIFETFTLVMLKEGVGGITTPPPPPLVTGGTTGAGVPDAFDTVIVTSYALVERVWVPFEREFVFDAKVYGDVVSVPWREPST